MINGNVLPLRSLRSFRLIAGLPANWYQTFQWYGDVEFTLVLPGAAPEVTWPRAEEVCIGGNVLVVQYDGQAFTALSSRRVWPPLQRMIQPATR